MSEVRRSARIRSKSSVESHDDVDEEEVRVDVDTAMEKPFSDEDESSDEEEDAQDEDYEETSNERKRKAGGQNGRSASKRGKSNTGHGSRAPSRKRRSAVSASAKEDQEQFLEAVKDFQPTEMFEILATSEDVSIEELARNWLETYKGDREEFLKDFINLLLCCCGAVAHVETHDVRSNESSNETIEEVQLVFQKQKIHEFHLLISKNSKRKSKYPHLYSNFVELMSRLMDLADEVQLICTEYTEDDSQITTGPFVLDLLTWLSTLSVCRIRCLRYIATQVLYLFQDYLTEHIVDLERKYLSKLSKQLRMEQQKKRPNKKTLEKLESTIEEVQSNKMVVRDIIDQIIKLSFVHRFKDVDDHIRSLSMKHLSVWIQNYPEYFMKVTFLKYYGWLLSDSSAEVRSQVLKILPDLISKQHSKVIDNSAVRQFFERFKERILEMALKDEVLDVKMNAVNVLIEVAALGYLENHEILSISSLIFDEKEVKVSSRGKSTRFLMAVAKFFAQVTAEKIKDFLNNHALPNTLFEISTPSLVKIGIFMRLLKESFDYHLQDKPEIGKKSTTLFQAAEFLYPSFGSLIKEICAILIYDGELQHPALNGENPSEEEEAENEDASELLLPNDVKSSELYITVLYGLCYGGANIKAQPRFDVAEAVLPQLDRLVNQLSLQSGNMLSSLTGIFNLFSFEDWIHTGYEKNIRTTLDKFIKAFSETHLSCELTDVKYKAFSDTVQHVKELKLNELDQCLQNQAIHIKILLEKFLDEKLNDEDGNILELFELLNTMFINKLTLLGKYYPVEMPDSLLDKFLSKYLLQIPLHSAQIDYDLMKQISFNILALAAAWEIQKWADILTNRSLDKNEQQIPQLEVQLLHKILDAFKKVLTAIHNDNANKVSSNFLLKLALANPFIDIIISIKVFQLRLSDNQRSLQQSMEELVPRRLSLEINSALLSIFLYLEGLCAQQLGVHLERSPEEDANLNDIDDEHVSKDCEKVLLIFTIKLKGLIKIGLLDRETMDRIALNKSKLPVLFGQVIDDTIFDQEKKPHSKVQHVGESIPEEPEDIDMLQDDPIEDSEI
ncbi:hypothetical protein HG536_0C04490 [Torulaspora globosa]|uniref:SCD domain-containing protein n=1 Tax=Torulaspora globosa TaxID=48254 RepID=A0A7G3ZFJ4_9SACH|nr:uncharacterized protein HG536_0C04490 [Torulaspora globosa]QLL32280.1 hypothetical protein HG536_0C04490 [Torulaspora globosa]